MGGYSTECAWSDITRRKLRLPYVDVDRIYMGSDERWMRDLDGAVDAYASPLRQRAVGVSGPAVSKCPACSEVPVRISREVDRHIGRKWSIAIDSMRCGCGHEYVSRSRVLTASVAA